MHYIAKNPKNTKVYQKVIRSCKYFFVKNPILVISKLCYYQNGWKACVNRTRKRIDINRISSKLWINDELCIYPRNVTNNSVTSLVIPKIYDLKRLSLHLQILSFREFMFLCSSVEELSFGRVTVMNDDGTVVSFEKLIEQLPKVKEIKFTFTTPSNNTSKAAFKELWKIPHLSNYEYFYLGNILGDFDFDSFYSFMKKNKKTLIDLDFSDQISEEYKTRLEAIIDEIIDTKNHEYKPPCIYFPGIDYKKSNLLDDISYP